MEPHLQTLGEGQASGPGRREASEVSLRLPSSLPGGPLQTVGQGEEPEPSILNSPGDKDGAWTRLGGMDY